MTTDAANGPRPLHRLAVRLDPDHLTDGQLLARYRAERDEVAFALLVRRHGGMVYGVCRRVLPNPADADDAFQAAFVVLVRKADGLTDRPTVGDWLHGVAVRVALKARSAASHRRRKEERAARNRSEEVSPTPPADPVDWFDRELTSLPPHYREPVVLCLIQDRPRADAAAALGIPEGTLASRLAYARRLLADRLTRRGVVLPAAFGAAVPRTLADSASAQAVGAAVPSQVSQLATGVIRAMAISKLRLGALAAVAGLVLAGGGVLLAGPGNRGVKRNAPVPEKKEPPEPAWMANFRKAYRLKDGEYVKTVAPPYIDERKEFLLDRFTKKGWKADAEGTLSWLAMGALFLEDDGKTVTYKTMLSTEADDGTPGVKTKKKRVSLTGVIECCTGLMTPEVVYDDRAKHQDVFMEADFVLRKGAPLDKLIPDLQKAIGECELGVTLTPPTLTLKQEEQEVYVVGGKFAIQPREWREKDEIDVYADEAVVLKGYSHTKPGSEIPDPANRDLHAVWNYTTSVETFARDVGSFVGRRVAWDAEFPMVPKFHWYRHDRWGKQLTAEQTAADHDPEKVLANVTEQTGLTFKKEKRKVPVLYVSVPEQK